jgi:hypothetical protein
LDKTVEELHERIESETERLLGEQFKALGVEAKPDGVVKVFYPQDPNALADYQYRGQVILRSYWSDMAVHFVVPKLETPKGEVQCTTEKRFSLSAD